MLYQFLDLQRPIEFRSADAVVESIQKVLRGWSVREWQGGYEKPLITVRRTLQGWGVTSHWTKEIEIYPELDNVTCDLIAELARTLYWRAPGSLCLHCAAVRMKDGVVIFPSTYRAGKSILTAHLAEAGYRVFSDDVVPVDPETRLAMAPGFLPRLRVPLPENATKKFSRFVKQKTVLIGKRYHYIDPGPDLMAAFGEEAPIIGVVLLERSESPVKASMKPQSRGTAMQHAILRNFSRNVSGDELVQGFLGIVQDAPCYQLTYSDTPDAVKQISAAFNR